MNLPTGISVLGTWVKVLFTDDIPSNNDEYLHGMFEPAKNKITIRKDTPEEMYRTLIHELVHAHLHYSGVTQVFNERYEESLCCLLENFTKIFTINSASRYVRWKKARKRANGVQARQK